MFIPYAGIIPIKFSGYVLSYSALQHPYGNKLRVQRYNIFRNQRHKGKIFYPPPVGIKSGREAPAGATSGG